MILEKLSEGLLLKLGVFLISICAVVLFFAFSELVAKKLRDGPGDVFKRSLKIGDEPIVFKNER